MSDGLKVGDFIPTDSNGLGVVVEIDCCTIAPDKLVKIRIAENVYVWIKMSEYNI